MSAKPSRRAGTIETSFWNETSPMNDTNTTVLVKDLGKKKCPTCGCPLEGSNPALSLLHHLRTHLRQATGDLQDTIKADAAREAAKTSRERERCRSHRIRRERVVAKWQSWVRVVESVVGENEAQATAEVKR